MEDACAYRWPPHSIDSDPTDTDPLAWTFPACSGRDRGRQDTHRRAGRQQLNLGCQQRRWHRQPHRPSYQPLIATIPVGGNPTQLTADIGAIWVATAKGLQRINPATNRVIQTLPPTVGSGYVQAVDGHLWVSLNDGTVQKLDPADGRVLASVSVAPTGASILASDGTTLWAANGGTVVVISPQRATITERVNEDGGRQRGKKGAQFTSLALTGGVAWGSRSDGRVLRFEIDPSNNSTATTHLAKLEGPALIAAGPAGVLVASPSTQTVTRLDFTTGQVIASIQLPGVCQVAVGADAAWVTAENQGTLYRMNR